MPESTSGDVPPALVARLRAAGCVFAEQEAALLAAAAGSSPELEDLVRRRVDGRPLEHVLGWVDFCGLRLTVRAGVFVPRRRTGFLVRCAAETTSAGAVVVDMCCGCGAVGAVLAAADPTIELHAVDVDPEAARCARSNLEPRGGHVYLGDLYAPLPESLRGRVDVIVANAPYVPTSALATMPPEARLHEPGIALDGGGDGLEVYRRLAIPATEWLAPGGCLLVETGARQAAATAEILAAAGLAPQVRGSDTLDATVVVGRRSAILHAR